jgi:septal ring factor EnvC (AmiA/AmiB activator)
VARYLILFFVEIYRLVHSFLVAHAHVKAAKAVHKAAKEAHIEGIKKASHTTLESVLREWQQNKNDAKSLKAEVQALTEKLASMRAQSTATQAKSSSSGRSSSDSSSSDS